MADLGLPIFDTTVQETNAWLKDIGEALDTSQRQEAYHAFRAVAHALRDRLPISLAANIAAQLPHLARGIFYEGYHPADKPRTTRTREEWNAAVRAVYDAGPMDPEQLTRAVFSTFSRRLDAPITEKVFAALPAPVRELWTDIPEAVAHDG